MRRGRDFATIYDLTAVRVIVESVKDCYGALGAVHSVWKPIPGRFIAPDQSRKALAFFATGVGGGSLTYLNIRSKTGPIFSVKSPMYFSKVPS